MLLFEAHSELLHRHLRLWRSLRHPGGGRTTHGKAYAGEKDSKVNGTHSGQVWSMHCFPFKLFPKPCQASSTVEHESLSDKLLLSWNNYLYSDF